MSNISLKEKYNLFINGEWVKPKSGEWLNSLNPANGEKLAEIADAGQEDVDLAVKAAKNAFENGWKTVQSKKDQ